MSEHAVALDQRTKLPPQWLPLRSERRIAVRLGREPTRPLGEWRTSQWRALIDELCLASGLGEQEFDQFLQSLRILHGPAADFVHAHRLTHEGARLASEIAAVLPRAPTADILVSKYADGLPLHRQTGTPA